MSVVRSDTGSQPMRVTNMYLCIVLIVSSTRGIYIYHLMYSNPNLDHVCCSESIAAAAAAARVNISAKVADVERVSRGT